MNCYACNTDVEKLEDRISELEQVVEAVANVGNDFGFGEYVLEPHIIQKARDLLKEQE